MDIISYWPLLWLIALAPLLLVYRKSLVERRRPLKVLSFVLRCLGIFLLIWALCRPYVSRRTEDVHLLFLVDVSESIDLDAAGKAVDIIRQRIEELRSGDSWSMYCFASELRRSTPDELQKQLQAWSEGLSDDVFRSQSLIAETLLNSRLAFPAGKAKRVVLFSDGRQTRGDLEQAVKALAKEGIDLRVSPMQGISKAEVAVVSLIPSTPTAYFGERVKLTATIFSNRITKAKLRFLNRGVLEAEIPIKLEIGDDNRVSVDLAMNTTGSSVWTVELVAPDDHFAVNNRSSATIEVKGRANVLVLHEKPSQMRAFKRALSKQAIDVDVRGKYGLPQTLTDMLEFDAIVIANLPATAMTTRQMINLKSYVSDFGGGLIMLGSENSFGLGGYYKTPVEEVLPIVSRYEKEKEQPSMAMVLVVDKSGSMQGMPIALARQAAKASAELLGPRDQIAIIAFDGVPFTVVEMTFVVDSYAISAAVDRIIAGGGTNMYPAMELGRQALDSTTAKIKHMIILTDGMSMPGDFHGLANEMAEQNMTVSTVALGNSADRALLKSIADIGRGRYYQTTDPDTVPRIFTKETVEASRSAIHEEPFTPIRIAEADMLEGIDFDQAPFLLGYVMCRSKLTAKTLLLTETGDPLLATARFGLGVSLAFTSDASGTWASEWLRWSGFGKFWAQALRSCLRKSDSSGILISSQESDGQTRYRISRKDSAGTLLNALQWEAIMLDQDGRRHLIPVNQVGLGLYEARVDTPQVGRYTLRFHDKLNAKTKIIHHHQDYPAEYRLSSEPAQAFGRLNRLSSEKIFKGLDQALTKQPLQNPLLVAAILCFITGVLLRRINIKSD